MDVASSIAASIAGQPRADADHCFTAAMESKLATNRTDGANWFAGATGVRAGPQRGADHPRARGHGHPT
ncbi:hypothetical protein ACFQDG_10040 [Natronoarchaeum mannanilyticum]|uniref:Uncharacterized protein n=1 Tax=Natronoarchaeum mannanilyticum TaxID=926360 RepID=A0AAV3TA28_9EURY